MEALRRNGGAAAAGLLAILAAVAAFRWSDAPRLPFLNDDYLFLDKAARTSFFDLWGFRELAFHWWRPWSRELHYWALSRAFGAHEPAFHVANALLWLAALGLYAALARRAVGGRAAVVATLGAAAMAAWDLPLLWAAGAQDLWMIAWSLAALLAWASDRRAWAALAFALALASKETAALLPVVAIAWDVGVARRAPVAALRRAWPLALLTLAWAAVHPVLGGRLWQGAFTPLPPSPAAIPAWLVPLRAVGLLASADAWPAPQAGWPVALLRGAGPALLLAGAAWWTARREAARTTRDVHGTSMRALAALAAAWAAAGWAPLLQPGLGWHAYYGLFGALGAWLLMGAWLAKRPAVAGAAVAAVALLGAARADTPSADWGDAWYQRRAGYFVARMRDHLRALHPSWPAHSRLWFSELPNNVGFLSGDGPALRVWYADPTLRAGFQSAWRPRAAGESAGEDYFFRADSLRGWIEMRTGAEDAALAERENPRWSEDQQSLATLLLERGDAPRAAAMYRKVADARPRDAEPAYNVGVAMLAAGDTLRASQWFAEAARRPDVNARVRAAAREAGLELWR